MFSDKLLNDAFGDLEIEALIILRNWVVDETS